MSFSELKARFREKVVGGLSWNREGTNPDVLAPTAAATPLADCTAELTLPAWLELSISNYSCAWRLLDADRIITRRIAEGLRFPDRDMLEPALSREEVMSAEIRFREAAGEVASQLAIHGEQSTGGPGLDGAGWRRIDSGAPWPQPALDALQKCWDVMNEYVPVYLSYILQVGR